MFESIIFTRQKEFDPYAPVAIGSLVEAMLFYQHTTVIADEGILTQLVNFFGPDNLLTLINEEILTIQYTESTTGIMIDGTGSDASYAAMQFTSPNHQFDDTIRKLCIDKIGKAGKGRRVAIRLESKINAIHHDPEITMRTNEILLDEQNVNKLSRTVLQEVFGPQIDLSEAIIETRESETGVQVSTNINFPLLSLQYKSIAGPDYDFDIATLFRHILEAESALHFATQHRSELSASRISTTLASQRISHLFEAHIKNQSNISKFNDFIFPNSHAIGASVEKGLVPSNELTRILIGSKKFKDWIKDIPPNQDLIAEYYRASTKETLIDKLPSKGVRWSIFTAAGALLDISLTGGIATAASTCISAFDALVLDNLIKQWKPSHFMEDKVKRIITKNHPNTLLPK